MTIEKEQVKPPKVEEGNAPYPYYTIDELLTRIKQIATRYGIAGQPAPRKEVCVLLGKAEPTLVYFFGSSFQYKLLENTSAKGVIVTDLFEKIDAPVFGEEGKKNAMLEAFINVPIYKRLVDSYNNKVLPDEEGLANLLKTKEYGVNSNSSARASKVFYANGKLLDIIDANNRLRYIAPLGNGTPPQKKDEETPTVDTTKKKKNDDQDDSMFEQPIDLGTSTAYLKYPRGIKTSEIAILKIMLNATLAALEARQDVEAQKHPLVNNVTKKDGDEMSQL